MRLPYFPQIKKQNPPLDHAWEGWNVAENQGSVREEERGKACCCTQEKPNFETRPGTTPGLLLVSLMEPVTHRMGWEGGW